MYGRPTILFPLALLALLALLTFWIQRTVQAPAPKMDGSARHDPDYILNNFVTTQADPTGFLRYRLIASELKHFPDDDSTELTQPYVTRYDPDKPSIEIKSERGSESSNGESIQFIGNVRAVRQASEDRGEMVVLTDHLTLLPKKDLAMTDAPVVITQEPKTVIHATGMIYDKKQQTVKLLKDVRVHYERPSLAKASESPNPQKLKTTEQTSKKTKANKPASSVPPKKTSQSSPRKNVKKKPTPKQSPPRVRRQYDQAPWPQAQP
jgi:lipopolysaccharide export system protein LptC